MKILYADCFSGISGDMFVGAMLGLGVDAEKLQTELKKLGVGGYEIKISSVLKNHIACTDFDVLLDGPDEHAHAHTHHAHRSWRDIKALLESSDLSAKTKALSVKIFNILSKAEAKVHGVNPEDVEFHEVGAVDSIVDIVSAAFCVTQLAPDKIVFSPLTEGGGTVNTAHGPLPVPVPATAEILSAAKIPFCCGAADTELVTPTGAAIAAALAQEFSPLPPMTAARVGYGCGKKQLTKLNALRVFFGESAAEEEIPPENADEAAVLETCVDDSTGEELGGCVGALFAAGALDAYFTPVFMKKNRPAYCLTVLCRPCDRDAMARIIFAETGSIGLRERVSRRIVMERRKITVSTKYGELDGKECTFGELRKIKPEFDSVQNAAEKNGVSPAKVREAFFKGLPCNIQKI